MEQKEPQSNNDTPDSVKSGPPPIQTKPASPSKAKYIVITIFAVALAVVIGLGGWLILRNDKNNNDSQTNTSQIIEPANNEGEEEQYDPSEGGKYLVIEEWGVRFPLPEELRGDLLTYVSTTDVSGTTLFASKRLNTLTGDDSCDLIKQPNGSYSGGIQASLIRINPLTYPTSALESYKTQLDGPIKKVDDYDYYSRKQLNPPITCLTGVHEEFNNVEESISNQLKGAFKAIEALE